MRETLKDLEEHYNQYLSTIRKLEQDRVTLRGIWSSVAGNTGPGSDSSNDIFYDGVRLCVKRFADTNPTSQEALIIMRFVLNHSGKMQSSRAADLMLEAVHGCLIPLIGFLSEDNKKEFLEEYLHVRPAKSQLPVQIELVRALQKEV